mmetsp:Transcript_37370/g.45064  ORF Transcript_37370/g.45064 Transcript_37370/m.45064 type:complete len:277 (-) Transcript_37370:411-1241(-)
MPLGFVTFFALPLSLSLGNTSPLKDDRVEHGPQTLNDITTHQFHNIPLQMLLRINLPNIVHHDLLRRLALLLLHPRIIILRQFPHLFHNILITPLQRLKILHGQPIGPIPLVQIHEHLLLQLLLPIINHDGIIMTIQSVDQRLNAGFVQMPDIAGGLSRFLPQHHQLRIDQSKTINHNFPLHRLNRIHHQRHRPRIQRFERILGVNIDPTQPAPEPRVGMIPPNHHLRPPRLFQHIQHFGLKHRIDRFDTHTRPTLGHGEDIDAVDGVIVHELSEH